MEHVETIHGRYSKWDIYRESTWLGDTTFYIQKDGKPYTSCSSLSYAVEYIRERDR